MQEQVLTLVSLKRKYAIEHCYLSRLIQTEMSSSTSPEENIDLVMITCKNKTAHAFIFGPDLKRATRICKRSTKCCLRGEKIQKPLRKKRAMSDVLLDCMAFWVLTAMANQKYVF
jgi:hypothetical protein